MMFYKRTTKSKKKRIIKQLGVHSVERRSEGGVNNEGIFAVRQDDYTIHY
jgi:hypothetical protein